MAVKRGRKRTESQDSINKKIIGEITQYVDWDGSTPAAGGKLVQIHPLAKTIRAIKKYAKDQALTKTQEADLLKTARDRLANTISPQKESNSAEAKGKPSSVDIAAKGTAIDALLDGIKNHDFTPAQATILLKKATKATEDDATLIAPFKNLNLQNLYDGAALPANFDKKVDKVRNTYIGIYMRDNNAQGGLSSPEQSVNNGRYAMYPTSIFSSPSSIGYGPTLEGGTEKMDFLRQVLQAQAGLTVKTTAMGQSSFNTSETAAFKRWMTSLNSQSLTIAEAIEMAAASGAIGSSNSPGGGGGGGGGGKTVEQMDPEEIRQGVETISGQTLGKGIGSAERDQITDELGSEATAASAADQQYDVESRTRRKLRERRPGDAAVTDVMSTFDAFASMMGAGGSFGQSSSQPESIRSPMTGAGGMR